MSNIVRDYILSLYSKGFRLDGRKFDEYRDVSVEYGISSKSAEGSARVKIGTTEVVAGIKLDIGEPYADNPDEGTIVVNLELLPMSSSEHEPGPPGIDSIELSRVIDKAIREGKALNFKKLCIKEGESMWMVLIDIYPINDAGNLFDAGALAALAALKDAKFPKVVDKKVDYDQKTKDSLPLEKFPISVTVLKIGSHLVVDPLPEEEKVADARLTIAVSEDGTPCALQKGGDLGLTLDEIDNMVELAVKKSKELRKALK
ncbi:MAG TPA: exosome complex protein Rrp42 [Candidatus Nanoarchaeia archaeon]|nr:exosome complex protein Rrp42 [Candidatus Nanoarchaeia archaeon]